MVASLLFFFPPLETFGIALFEMDVKLRMEKELEQPQQETNELQKISQRLPRDANHLEEQLVDKDQQLSDARKRRQRRNMLAMNQLSAAALEESRQKLDGLQLNHRKKLEEQDAILQSQLEPTKGGVKSPLGEEVRGHQRELSEKEETMQRQQESFRKKLRELSELWQARTRQAPEKHGELEEKIQQKVENTKDEEPSQRNQLNNKREMQKIRRSSSGLCGIGRSGDGQ